jgi:hypothetical protein
MIREGASEKRILKTVSLSADLVVVGGGLSGTCCAITAARAGINVVLVQDRPVLGGNSSSEVRLWVLGATSHMGNNNRWAREGGVIDEILVENTFRNSEGNPIIFDTVLLEKVMNEKNIQLLLNTAVYEVTKRDAETISSVKAFCSQNSTHYELSAPLFCDASGDGVVAFQAGAAFRMGAEPMEEFGEKFAPTNGYGELLGHSIYFYSKDVGKPVKFIAPAYALDDITKIPRYKRFNAKEHGCQLWWIEYGGRLDTVHDTEKIKWELWKVVYGVWNYIKNSGNFPEAENLTLEWVGTIPGKRESRRFEGDYMLKQQDIVEQRTHDDAVAYGGWSIDLHPADGVFSEKPGCNQWHSKGVYQIPYRSMYSRNLSNLFLAGRIISVTHVAFGSSRVMATGACVGQTVGMAAAMCAAKKISIRAMLQNSNMHGLQQELLKVGHYIPGIVLKDEHDLAREAKVSASSEFVLHEIPANGNWFSLNHAAAQMLPLQPITPLSIRTWVKAERDTTLTVELRYSSKAMNHTPDVTSERKEISLKQGEQEIEVSFSEGIPSQGYGFICFLKNDAVQLRESRLRVSGVLSVFNKINAAVSNYGKQEPQEDIGIDAFEFWCPGRRPNGANIAMKILRELKVFGADNIVNGINRPVSKPNAWAASLTDPDPRMMLQWKEKKSIRKIVIDFDTDFDHPMETVLMTHPETAMPFCVQDVIVCDDAKKQVYKITGNHQSQAIVDFENPVHTTSLTFHFKGVHEDVPVSIFGIRCYETK